MRNGKMLSRDRSAHKFACGCCFEFGIKAKGRGRDRRQARRREAQSFREGIMGRWEM